MNLPSVKFSALEMNRSQGAQPYTVAWRAQLCQHAQEISQYEQNTELQRRAPNKIKMHTCTLLYLSLIPLPFHTQQGPRPRYSIAVCCAPDEKAKRHRGCTCLKARKRTFVNHNPNINIGFNRGFSRTLAGVHLAICFTNRAARFSACYRRR